MRVPSTGVTGVLAGAGGLLAGRAGRHRLALLLLSSSALCLFIASRIAMDVRREVVLTVGQWALTRLPEARAAWRPIPRHERTLLGFAG